MAEYGIQTEFNFDEFIDEKKRTLRNNLESERNSILELKRSIELKVDDSSLDTGKIGTSGLLKKIKSESDILGILPSMNTMIKHFDNLKVIEKIGGFNLENIGDSIFIQKFYKFFYKSKNGFSKESKESVIRDSEIVNDVKVLYDTTDLTDSDFKNIVQIYRLRVENGIKESGILAQKYRKSDLFRHNLENITLIHTVAFENGYNFEYVQKNLTTLLQVSYIDRGNSKSSIKENILSTLKALKDGKSIDFEEMFNRTTKKVKGELTPINRGNREIPLNVHLTVRLIVGTLKGENKQLTAVKDVLSSPIGRELLKYILKLSKPSQKKSGKLKALVTSIEKDLRDGAYNDIKDGLTG
jgi:hypothetical protein